MKFQVVGITHPLQSLHMYQGWDKADNIGVRDSVKEAFEEALKAWTVTSNPSSLWFFGKIYPRIAEYRRTSITKWNDEYWEQ